MDKFDLYIVTGNLGTGKTTTGLKLKQNLGTPMLDPDLMRRELEITEYDPKDTSRVMQEIWKQVINALREGVPVTLSTAYVRRFAREQSYNILKEISSEIGRQLQAVLIRCECTEGTSKDRITQRPPSDGLHMPTNNPSSYDRTKALDEPIHPEEIQKNPNISFIVFDTETNKLIPLAAREHHAEALKTMEAAILP